MTAHVPSACDADCSRSGVDEVDVSDPRKVWRCDGCGAEGTSHQLDAAHRAPVPSGPLSDEAVAALVCHAYETIGPRYEALALALMNAPDLGRALASLLGDHEARLDILAARVRHLECVLGEGQVKPHGR